MARDNIRTFSKLDFNFLGTALVIAAVGCLLIYSATYFDDPGLGIFRKQLLWLADRPGADAVLPLRRLPRLLRHRADPLRPRHRRCSSTCMAFGRLTANVRSWIHIGAFQFQPSEFMKIFTALMLAKFFDNHDRAYMDFKSFARAMLIIGLPVGLIIMQMPSMSSSHPASPSAAARSAPCTSPSGTKAPLSNVPAT